MEETLGKRIVSNRKRLGITQDRMAEQLGVTAQAVSKWETDQGAPDVMNLIRLADILDTDVEYLATGRKSYGMRPPVVIKTTETIEKIVEKPVVEVKEVIVEKIIEKPVIQVVEKPVTKKVYRTQYVRNPVELGIVASIFLIIGFLLGYFI